MYLQPIGQHNDGGILQRVEQLRRDAFLLAPIVLALGFVRFLSRQVQMGGSVGQLGADVDTRCPFGDARRGFGVFLLRKRERAHEC